MNYKYWMVHCHDACKATAPTVRHGTLAEATAEARRLAEKHAGMTFFVLEAITAFAVDTPTAKERRVDYAPVATQQNS